MRMEFSYLYSGFTKIVKSPGTTALVCNDLKTLEFMGDKGVICKDLIEGYIILPPLEVNYVQCFLWVEIIKPSPLNFEDNSHLYTLLSELP